MRGFTASILCGLLLQAGSTRAAQLEEIQVTAQRDTRVIDVAEQLSASPDVAEMLRRAPGIDVNRNGPITGIPQYRGLFGPRIAVSLDGNQIAPAGPNWMDPPLSYAVTAQLESLEVYRGIAPVSVAPEAIGGAVDARRAQIGFGKSDQFDVEARLAGGLQSATHGQQFDADIQASNRLYRFRLAGMHQAGDDVRTPGGYQLPSEYRRERYDLGAGINLNGHEIQLDVGHTDTGASGTPSLPMDIDYFVGDLVDLSYRYALSDTIRLEASVYGSSLDHGMDNYGLRTPPPVSGWRRNIATTENRGFRVRVEMVQGDSSWRLGADGFREAHDADIDNPNAPMFFLTNFNNAKRSTLGGFVEFQGMLSDRWRVELGGRLNRISVSADEVDGTPAMMMPAARALRDAFNAADRSQSDVNVDAVARLNFAASDDLSLYAGLASRSRSASYQERFLWMPLEATGGLADGQVYIGNLELEPERATVLEAGFDLYSGALTLRPRVFHNHIDDYIQGVPVPMMTPAYMVYQMIASGGPVSRAGPLQFQNVDAELYGFDVDWHWQFAANWSVSGIVNYVRGRRRDISDYLYRIAPPNTTVRLSYQRADWELTAEGTVYAAQDWTSNTNLEARSPGYGVLNLRGIWQATSRLQVAAGVDNLLDREYQPHLNGINRAANPDVSIGERLPAPGINLFGRLTYAF
jgi:iron complex outermembrane receptor protein